MLESFLVGVWVPLIMYLMSQLMVRKALAGYFKALNRHDLRKFMSAWQDDGVFTYPGEIPASGTFRGKSAIEGWFHNFFDQFPSIKFDVQDICVHYIFTFIGWKYVAAVHWNIQLTNRSGRTGQNSGVTVISMTGLSMILGLEVVMAKNFIFDLSENFKRDWGAA
jgi:ketosteroid isomerase-like protein